MNQVLGDDLAKLTLRVSVAGLMLLHGIAKLIKGLGGIEKLLASKGLPTFIAYGVHLGELVAPALMIAGIFTRPAAAIFVINLVIAVALAHPNDVLALGKTGGWKIELQALYIIGALVVGMMGPGRFSVSRGRGRWD